MRKRTGLGSLITVKPVNELALPDDLIGKAKNYATKSRARKTLQAYALWWRKFDAWCGQNGRQAMPTGMDTLCGFITCLADENKATTTIDVAISAIKFAHKANGHVLVTKDDALFSNVWSGIRRAIALKRSVRRVRPLTADQVREILDMLRPEVPREARDAAVLALCFAAALRRSELVGLDWQEMGPAEDDNRLGYLKADEDGMTVILMKSKASQDTAEDVAMPRDYAPILCRTIEHWVDIAKIRRGEPLFRAVSGRGWSENPLSGYRGVSWHARNGKWRAQAWVAGKNKSLGYFAEPYDAHKAYCKAAGVKPTKPHEGSISRSRMDTQQVARIVQRRVERWLEAGNRRKLKRLSKEEIRKMAKEYSGHSPRAGAVTSMIEAGASNHEVKLVSRHKSDSMLSTYFRPVEKRKNWAMRKVAF